MPDQQATELLTLSGRDFRSTEVSCGACSWSGTAGKLSILGAAALGNGVRYSCPSCETLLARHAGLSQADIAAELIVIRQQLAAELSNTLPDKPAAQPERGERSSQAPSFEDVRARIRELA